MVFYSSSIPRAPSRVQSSKDQRLTRDGLNDGAGFPGRLLTAVSGARTRPRPPARLGRHRDPRMPVERLDGKTLQPCSARFKRSMTAGGSNQGVICLVVPGEMARPNVVKLPGGVARRRKRAAESAADRPAAPPGTAVALRALIDGREARPLATLAAYVDDFPGDGATRSTVCQTLCSRRGGCRCYPDNTP